MSTSAKNSQPPNPSPSFLRKNKHSHVRGSDESTIKKLTRKE